MITTNIIGLGRVGKALLSLISGVEGYAIQAVFNRTPVEGATTHLLSDLPPADIHLITTSDDAIALVAADILTAQKNTCLIHCSGALAASICNPASRADVICASAHPLQSFPADSSLARFTDCLCAIEGDKAAIQLATDLFQALGANCFTINSSEKSRYHAASVIASNYVVTLASLAKKEFMLAGLPESIAKKATENLIESALSQLKANKKDIDALTGPLKRGDMETIKKHLHTIEPDTQSVYRELAHATLPLTTLNDQTRSTLVDLLSDES